MTKKIGFPNRPQNETPICDFFDSTLESSTVIASYFCDTIWSIEQDSVQKLPTVMPHEAYCLDCYTDEIPLPRKGTTEGFAFETIKKNDDVYIYEEKCVAKSSKRNEGVEWNPKQLVDEFIGEVPINDYPMITPYWTYLAFYRSGVDLRTFVRDNQVEIPSAKKKDIHRIFSLTREFSQKGMKDALM